VVSQDIDPATGTVVPTIKWSAQAELDKQTGASTDSRTIYMFDGSAPSRLKPFQFASMNAAEQGYFKDRCVPSSTLSQCVALSSAQLADANNGTNMVNYLRGQRQFEGSHYRRRSHILGDTVNATPAFVREPRQNFGDAGYGAFKAANASRQAMLYVGASDGFLHAFDADTGRELWAYTPAMVLPNLYKLAEDNYATNAGGHGRL
jgi:type IV pilus assembly protein PilY1